MKKVIIIGAGVSGLSAGIYALQSGFDVEIYEQHFMTGGVCTSWSRKGYTFEGAVHWLTGSSPNSPSYRLWTETNILNDNVKTYRHDPYCVLEYQGQQLNLFRDVEKLKAHFLAVSPQDEQVIELLYKDIKTLMGLSMPIMDEKGVKVAQKSKFGLGQMAKMLPAFTKMKRLSAMSAAGYAALFSHEGLRELLTTIIPSEYNAMGLIAVMATFADNGHFPEGGALGLASRMTDKFTKLGGKLFLSTKVDKVSVDHGKTNGIIVNGKLIAADAVIITQDVMTATKLFDNPPDDGWIKEIQENTTPQLSTLVGIGVSADMSDIPHQFYFKPSAPVIHAGQELHLIGLMNYAAHPEYAPHGGTALTVCFVGDTYDWWAQAKADGRYADEKKALAEQVTRALTEQFPQLEGNIEVIDIATPLTYERYTGSYKGSWMSVMTKGTAMRNNPVTCEKIGGVYFAGFRTQSPGGLPVAVTSGRRAAQLVCKQFNVEFQ